MAVGWSCPRCDLVLAPSVTEHRCDPPAAGVTTAAPWQPITGPGTVHISPPNVTVTAPDIRTVTTGTGSYAPGAWTITGSVTSAPHLARWQKVDPHLAAVPDTDAMRAITETAA